MGAYNNGDRGGFTFLLVILFLKSDQEENEVYQLDGYRGKKNDQYDLQGDLPFVKVTKITLPNKVKSYLLRMAQKDNGP